MRNTYHLVGIVCAVLLILVLALIFHLETDKSKINEFIKYRDNYNNNTAQMNQLMQKYNNQATLSVERVEIIQEYLNAYDERKQNIRQLENFVNENNDFLDSKGVNSSRFLNRLNNQKQAIYENIEGFKEDLNKMNRSVLISYTEKQRNKYEQLVQRIKDY